ncbi:sn-glycerol-3-phosphate import ATP-binding protein UgpC [Lentilitoribacter sp. Alg239-R112]|jgi:sn-glycerol 3-phosphate transport system ATP-binding protein|uniref:sn-glycerol-3-phosphate import ATP-binding protein UgpC n=1 Tax=Lentilitoribacter sp. Alg239-R112 TaxID=2305987 RepID=UPI0013A68B44|nr:sn-glycerol-3-phosphate import ATP-binding protein UgpC [Lentilitoribacter sp. Alg239-R112]
MATVSLKTIQKVYSNGFKAVHGANLDIQDGEFIVLVGPSGCGKSTLLRMVAGLEEITNGDLFIGNKKVNDVDPAERDIAMVFQNYALYPHMTVYNNMAYGLRNRKFDKAQIDAAVKKAAKMLNLEDFLDRKPSQLSGGQRQRVAMGRATVRNPALFLFDEPLSNLDAKLRSQMRIEIRKLQRQLGTTSIYVTHDQVEAMTMADRIVVLNGGHIEQVGTPDEIYNKPASTFVASFMGAPPMNMIPGELDKTGKLSLGELGDIKLSSEPTEDGDVLVGIRPEKVQISNVPNGVTQPFSHDFTEELGATRLVHGKLGHTPFIVNLPQENRLPDGDLHIALNPENLHIFDKDKGTRIELKNT